MSASSAPEADAAARLQDRLREDLKHAMRARDALRTRLLRGLIASVDDAQAVPVGTRHDRYEAHAFGDRSAEVPRLTLTPNDVDALLRREIGARESAAEQMQALGQDARADELRAEAGIARRYLTAG